MDSTGKERDFASRSATVLLPEPGSPEVSMSFLRMEIWYQQAARRGSAPTHYRTRVALTCRRSAVSPSVFLGTEWAGMGVRQSGTLTAGHLEKVKESRSVSESRDSADASPHASVYLSVAALHRAGRLDDALALLRAGGQAQPTREVLAGLLLRGRILTDTIFHANRGYADAETCLVEAGRLAEQSGDEIAAADAREVLGLAEYYRALQAGSGDYRGLLVRFQETLARREELGDTRGIAESSFHVGLMHERLGESIQATEAYERAHALAREHGHKVERSYAARHLGGISEGKGDLDAALAYFRESLAMRQEVGLTLGLPLAHIAVGDVLLARQEVNEAARHYQQAYAFAAGMQSPLTLVFALLALSQLAQARGDNDARRAYAERALSQAQVDDLPLGIRVASALA
jgi:tetratricopeptide (TPR) repeat protein